MVLVLLHVLVHALHAQQGVLLLAVEDYCLLLVLKAADVQKLMGLLPALAALADALAVGVNAAPLA